MVSKTLTVYFYVVEPFPEQTFAPGGYPQNDALYRIRQRDPAADDYRIKDRLFGGEMFCLLHEDGPQPVLGTYYKDMLARPQTERKGVVREIELEDGEGLVDVSYATFFPSDVVGIVRTSAKAPSFARLGQWLSIYGGYPCALLALPDADTLAQIDRAPSDLQRIWLRMRRSHLGALEGRSTGVAQALRSAAEANVWSDQVGVDLAVGSKTHQRAWALQMRSEIHELLAVLPEFETARVKLSGVRRPINLKRSHVTSPVQVQLQDSKRIGPNEGAEALFAAYEHEQASIERAAAIWWSREASGPANSA